MELNERFRSFLPVVVDLETGGTQADIHALLELSITLLDWEEDRLILKQSMTWEITPHPETEVTEKSLEVTQINLDDPERNAESEDHVLREAFRLIRREIRSAGCTRAMLTAHNAHFDHGFIMAAAKRNNINRNPFHPFTVMDTASLCGVTVGHTVLNEAAKRLDIHYEREYAHSSAYDADIAAKVFCAIVNRSSYSEFS